MKYKIREATEIDIPSIMKLVEGLAIYEKLEHEMVATADDFAKFGFGENRYFHALLAADESGEDVGFALYFFTFSTFLAKPTLFLEDLFVMPDHRGNGIGIELLSELAKIAIEKECGRMEWSVLDWNEPSIEFYKNLGARPMDDWTNFRLLTPEIQQLAALKKDNG